MRAWIWVMVSVGVSGVLGAVMMRPQWVEPTPLRRTVFLPGDTSDGHYQIELDCDACHREAFGGPRQMQEACEGCHAAELARVDDSHPQRKFTDPRNADRVASLDARWCVTCHREHRPEVTSAMGLSLPADYCFRCHEDVGEERPTHAGLAFDSCASGGCHNFHDNQALYEDFLVEHRGEPALTGVARVPERGLLAWSLARDLASAPLAAGEAEAPPDLPERDRWVSEWTGTAHAQAGVNCRGCHRPEGAAWTDRPQLSACEGCHEAESAGFLAGRHGMRVAAGMAAMTPGDARLPMREDAAHRELDCQSCHPAHGYDTPFAAAEACLHCHADDHSLAWEGSAHAAAWRDELEGRSAPGTGVSCATCHLPRIRHEDGPDRIVVAHNQNDTLRPNEKMIRTSCLACHGLGFALSSLADPLLVARNFRGVPSREVQSIHFASELRWELEGRAPPWEEEPEEKETER